MMARQHPGSSEVREHIKFKPIVVASERVTDQLKVTGRIDYDEKMGERTLRTSRKINLLAFTIILSSK